MCEIALQDSNLKIPQFNDDPIIDGPSAINEPIVDGPSIDGPTNIMPIGDNSIINNIIPDKKTK